MMMFGRGVIAQKVKSSIKDWLTLRKKCPYSELFWSAFSRIQTEYGEVLSIESECRKYGSQ